jgi:CHAT domain-containing protein/tetratricopeptide (TPR) repeat protein
MAICLLRSVNATCAGCHTPLDEPVWVAIDLVERPNLRTMLASGAVATISCARCGTQTPRTEPLLVTRLSPVAPVLLALPYDRLQGGGDLAAASQPLIQEVRQRMGDEARDMPGPLLVLPFDVLAIAASRDLIDDIRGIDAARAEVGGEGNRTAMNYALFLEDVLGSMPERRLNFALSQFRGLLSVNELERLVDEYPELATQAARDEVTAWLAQAGDDEERHVASARLEMLQLAARGDYGAAWERYEQAAAELLARHVGPRIDQLRRDFYERERAGDLDAALAVGEELLEIARMGANELEMEVSSRMAAVLLAMPGPGRADRVERVIVLLTRTVELLDGRANANDRLFRVGALTNLGFAFSVRPHGDPLVNQEQAIALYRQVLGLITMDDDGYSWALAQTNLGLSLLERAHERRLDEPAWEGGPEPPARVAEIDEAIDHFHAALRWRSFERDPGDWAFTQANLGLAFSRRPGGNRAANLRRSLEHYEHAERGFAAAGDRMNHAQVLHNLSSEKLVLAHLEATPEDERQELLRAAVDNARASVSERTLDEAPVDAGRAWRQLGESLRAVGDVDGAIDAYDHALRGLTVEVAPRHARDAARALGNLAAESGRWELAAGAYETAAVAAAQAWEARATFAGRIDELHENLNIFRWAAYTLTKAGRLERAVEILELGRARELARWLQADLIDLERLRDLDPQLADRYTALRLALSRLDRGQRTGGHVDGAEAATVAEQLAATVDAIRALPGFDMFLRMPRFSDAVAALRHDDALVYLVTSPDGALALVVTRGSGGGEVRLVEASALRSPDLFRLYMTPDLERETLGGYLTAHAGLKGSLEEALARFADTLGPDLLKPLRDALAAVGARTVCLIPISLLGVLPLHALAWSENGTERCLLDEFTVIFAASALVRAVCLRRAARATRPRRIVVVGNPLPQRQPLPGAEFEAAMVAQALAAEELDLLVGTAATKEAVVASLPGATHVHLACHGTAAILDRPMNAALSLAGNQPLNAEEILELDGFAPRLVVASACETGVIQGYETADEALTLGAMFVAAGAAGVVSTLWSISDLATALMMSRFYELLARQLDEQPAVALREAQLWLRELTIERAEAYIAAHPLLREHRAARGEGLRADSEAATASPFSEITTWGAFVFSGA